MGQDRVKFEQSYQEQKVGFPRSFSKIVNHDTEDFEGGKVSNNPELDIVIQENIQEEKETG